jgi:hypothetical protein
LCSAKISEKRWQLADDRGAQFESVEKVSALQLRVELWNVNHRATEAEESPFLRFVTRKRLVKTLQRNSHCG